MTESAKKKIVQEVIEYQSAQVQIVPGFYFNQYYLINQIFFYANSKFQSGDTDVEGDRKYFLNVSRNPCKICTKGIDFDTKDIRLLTTGGGDPNKTWFMERDLKYWMRDKEFGKVLNRIFQDLPIYGTVVLKILDGVPYFVDLRNFIVEQSAENLESMNYKIEIHNLTIPDFKKIANKMGWKQSDVDDVIKKFHDMRSASHIVLWERYGELEQEDGSFVYQRTFVADVIWNIYDTQNNRIGTERGIVLASEDWEGSPYREIHMEKMRGRWLGIGIVETLFEPQIRVNELANVQSKATYWAGLRVFQTRDNAINRNLMTDVSNGEIINADSEITQIGMEDRNLSFFNEEHAKWMANVESMTIAFAPVGHSVIAIQIAQDQVVSYFEQIKENVALEIKKILYDDVIPQFEKDATPEHILRLVGQDLDIYISMVQNELVFQEIVRQALMGNFPSAEDKATIEVAIQQTLKQKKEKLLTIPSSFYDDVKYDVDIDITGESVDTRARYQTRLALLQAITADPTMLTDPTKKKIVMGMAEDGGLNAAELFSSTPTPTEAAVQQPPQRGAGGGVSSGAMPMNRMPGAATKTL